MLAALLTLAMAQDAPIQLENYWFVYFVRGTNKEPLGDEAGKKAMEGHLANLTRLSDEGKAVAAGPFAGTQDRRGIVILKSGKYMTKEDVAREFAADPYVKADRLRVDIHPWATGKGAVKKWKTPEEMKSYVFVVLDRGEDRSALSDKESNELQAAHLKHINEMMNAGELGIAGPFRDDTDMRGIFIFKHADAERAKKLVDQDPLIKRGRLKATYLTLWMAAGIVGD
jgi:uncharacterized protein YciI